MYFLHFCVKMYQASTACTNNSKPFMLFIMFENTSSCCDAYPFDFAKVTIGPLWTKDKRSYSDFFSSIDSSPILLLRQQSYQCFDSRVSKASNEIHQFITNQNAFFNCNPRSFHIAKNQSDLRDPKERAHSPILSKELI